MIVSNRLPITVMRREDGFRFKTSIGGLVSGISSYLDSIKGRSLARKEYAWIGWPGVTVESEADQVRLGTTLREKYNAYPVFLTEAAMDSFYHGFCNKIIWPLFHGFPSYVVYDETTWEQYQRVNEQFCDSVSAVVEPGDVVWIHDYHLMLLPRYLRERRPDAAIGFFLHIPFPSFEIFRLLPDQWRRGILEGLLGADLVGFHTYDYTNYFTRCVVRMLGHDHTMGWITTRDRRVRAETFPMGIDYERFHAAAQSQRVAEEREKIGPPLAGNRVILSIDRLDYSKGITNRLEGYRLFLERNPEHRRKVVLVLVVVPSRIGVEHYQAIKSQIDGLVGEINGRFGGLDWTPIIYQYRFVGFNQLVALYRSSDIALITPLRDGMNLIAKEYLASRPDESGVLVLSEMAGAAEELREALLINPNSRLEIAEAIKTALAMGADEQRHRNALMQRRLRNYTVMRWAREFIEQLLAAQIEQRKYATRQLTSDGRRQISAAFAAARRRLLLLDYDGTLVPFSPDPVAARPGDELIALLRRLANRAGTELVLISGRSKNTLQDWFAGFDIGLIAEHGIWRREPGQEWQLAMPLSNDWIPRVREVMERYVDRLPGAVIEAKEHSVVFHYRRANRERGVVLAQELADNLINFTANMDLQVLPGSKVVEVRKAGVNKGTAVRQWLDRTEADFVLACGDDVTDEDMFGVLPETAWSVRVGLAQSHARFNVADHRDVLTLLEALL